MINRPSIGITKPDHGNRLSWWCIRLAIWLTGGKPMLLTPSGYEAKIGKIQGLVVAGGTDIHPALYDHAPKENYAYDPPRDTMEAALIKHCQNKNLPLMGICRGAQLLNVVYGGTLHFDIRKVYEKAEYPNGTFARIFYRKPMAIQEDTLLYRLLRTRRSKVNSIHTQAVDRRGKGIIVSAREPNGVIQAIERANHPFLLGVQFHPEYLFYRQRYRRLFRGLIEAARA